jgi:hypothetical protein
MLTVALYGSSLTLRSIGALLQHPAGLHVVEVNPTSAPPGTLPPDTDVLLFDLPTALTASILSLWHGHPRLALIGIDLQRHEAFLVSGRRMRVQTPVDLVRLIEGCAPSERSH